MRKFRSIFACFRGQSVVQSVRQRVPVESTVTVRVGFGRGGHLWGGNFGAIFFPPFFCCRCRGLLLLAGRNTAEWQQKGVCVRSDRARTCASVCGPTFGRITALRNRGSGRNCVRKSDFCFVRGISFASEEEKADSRVRRGREASKKTVNFVPPVRE